MEVEEREKERDDARELANELSILLSQRVIDMQRTADVREEEVRVGVELVQREQQGEREVELERQRERERERERADDDRQRERGQENVERTSVQKIVESQKEEIDQLQENFRLYA